VKLLGEFESKEIASCNLCNILTWTFSSEKKNSGFFTKAITCRKAGKSCSKPGQPDSSCCSSKCASNGTCRKSTSKNNNNDDNAVYNGVSLSFGSKITNTSGPTSKPSRNPTPKPQKAISTKISGGCASGEVKLTVEIKTGECCSF